MPGPEGLPIVSPRNRCVTCSISWPTPSSTAVRSGTVPFAARRSPASLPAMNIVHLAAGADRCTAAVACTATRWPRPCGPSAARCCSAPLYTPLRTDEESIAEDRIAFGGINVHLQQHWGLFRYTPWWLDRLLDHPVVLRWAGRRGAGTRPEDTAALAVSMLRGEEGRQRKELEKLLRWLRDEIHPDVVHLSTVLLCGLAREIRRRLGVPVVATLAGEDGFLEKLPQPHYDAARSELRARAAELDALVAPQRVLRRFHGRLSGPAAQSHSRDRSGIEPPGAWPPAVDSADQSAADHWLPLTHLPGKGATPVVGRLDGVGRGCGVAAATGPRGRVSRPCGPPLPGRPPGRPGLLWPGRAVRVRGRVGPRRKDRVPAIARRLQRSQRLAQGTALAVFEAWANGVPTVLPAHGAFPEMVADTGGGLLFEPGNAAALAAALRQLIRQPELAAACGRRAEEAVHQRVSCPPHGRRHDEAV